MLRRYIMVKSMNMSKGVSKAIASNYMVKQSNNYQDNAARRAIVHHWRGCRQVDPQLETTRFQPLSLTPDMLVSSLCF
jgi:hypothetical protein